MSCDPLSSLSSPCRATKPDGRIVVMYVGWAIVEDLAYEVINNPSADEEEAARQDSMESRIEANRAALAAHLAACPPRSAG